MALRVIFVDLNSYFASVEQAENPKLMGKPVAVVPMLADTTSCLAASYPAKAKGVKTGTLVRDAKRLCPGIIFVEADHRKYVRYHYRIKEAVERCLPIWRVFSIDEMAIRLFGKERDLKFAHSKAMEIKRRIQLEVHPALTCSVGVAPNRYIAKIASDMQKPNGLVVIHQEDLPQRLYGLKLRDFPGIGAKMEERLIAARCFTARELCEMSPVELRRIWGSKLGDELWHLIRGEDLDERDTERGSISHSRVLAPDRRSDESAWSTLVALLSKAAMRLRDEGFYAKSLHLYLKYLHKGMGTSYWDKHAKFFETHDTTLLLQEMQTLWQEAPRGNLLKVGVVLGGLVSGDNHQLSFTENVRRSALMGALDRLNKSYRKNLVVYGESCELTRVSHAPIAFGHIPDEFE